MKLDADPTVIYPVTKGKPLGRRILKSELNAANGYNTYRMRRPARGADRQSRQGEHRSRAASRADQGALLRRRRHRRPCLRGDAGGAECQCRQMVRAPPPARGRCEQPRDRPGADVHGRAAAVRGRHHLGARPDDEPARRAPSRQEPSMFDTVVVTFIRNSAIGTLVLCAPCRRGCCFPPRRPKWPARDWALIGADC